MSRERRLPLINRSIQILYSFAERLSIYLEHYRQGVLELPDFHACCPLCGARKCAEFLGYYQRAVVLEDGRLIADFPIARYRCRRRGSKAERHPHKTFSLLPHQLVPYSRISLPYLEQLMERYRELDCDIDVFLKEQSPSSLSHLEWGLELLDQAYGKLKATARSWPQLDLPATAGWRDLLGDFWLGVLSFRYREGQTLTGLAALGLDFYHRGGGWRMQAYFLWGTPSQFR